MKILLVDDEEMIIEFLKRALVIDGHEVDYAYDGAEGFEKARSKTYDAIILDIIMPEKDGLTVCREIREQGIGTPVLMLSTKQTSQDKTAGLDSGADDYLSKPFTYDELTARLRALNRRPREILPQNVIRGDVIVDIARHRVIKNDEEIELTPKEYAFLEYLCNHPHRAVSKEELLSRLWGVSARNSSNRAEVCVRNIRDKLNEDTPDSLIQTVRGFGYALRRP